MHLPSRIILPLCLLAMLAGLRSASGQDQAVTIQDAGSNYVLSNGIIKATIRKNTGDLASMVYKGVETVSVGYWSHRPGGAQLTDTITIDPQSNGGDRGEVSIRGISGGQQMGKGPGGSTIADVEVRWTL